MLADDVMGCGLECPSFGPEPLTVSMNMTVSRSCDMLGKWRLNSPWVDVILATSVAEYWERLAAIIARIGVRSMKKTESRWE